MRMIEDKEIEETLVPEKKEKVSNQDQSKSTKIVKYILLTINIITFIFGVVLLVVGCVYYSSHHSYQDSWTIGSSFCSASIFCIVIGIITCLVSCLGIFGALSSNYCCLLAFCILLGIIVFLETILAVTFFAVVSDEKNENLVANIMRQSMDLYDQNHTDHGVTKVWNLLQTELHCCGITGPDDWHKDAASIFRWANSNALPGSCCATFGIDETVDDCRLNSSDHYKVGCLKELKAAVRYHGGAIGGVIIVFALIQIGIIILAAHLTKKVAKSPKSCPPFY